jgi:hypothetical protein
MHDQRLSIEGSDGGAYCMSLWESGKQVIRARASLGCPGNRRSHMGEWTMEILTCRFTIGEKTGKANSNVVFGRQNGRKGSMKAHSHLERECSMRLVDDVRRILRLGGGSRVGRKLFGGLKSVVIPSFDEVLYKSFVQEYRSVEFVMCEAGSKLQRIEKSAFDSSGLKSIVIPSSVEVLCESCFSNCKSLSSITFESDSHLQRIEKSAFSWSGLKSIVIPSSIEVLCESCFSYCKSLSSISFESDSHLRRIEKSAFCSSGLKSIIIPSSVEVLCESCFFVLLLTFINYI